MGVPGPAPLPGHHALHRRARIRIDGDVAQVDTYCVAHHVSHPDDQGAQTDMVLGLRYVDRFERRQGEWKIALRTLVADWKQFVPVPHDQPRPPASQEVGRRDPDDFIFRERRALGIS